MMVRIDTLENLHGDTGKPANFIRIDAAHGEPGDGRVPGRMHHDVGVEADRVNISRERFVDRAIGAALNSIR